MKQESIIFQIPREDYQKALVLSSRFAAGAFIGNRPYGIGEFARFALLKQIAEMGWIFEAAVDRDKNQPGNVIPFPKYPRA